MICTGTDNQTQQQWENYNKNTQNVNQQAVVQLWELPVCA